MQKNKGYFRKIKYIIFSIIIYLIFSLKSEPNGYMDINIQRYILVLLLVIGYILLFKKKISDNMKIGILLIGIALYVSYPLYTNYLIWQHDSHFHLYRIENIVYALKNFQFPVRIHPLANNGYGYGVSLMYPELFIYIPAIFRLLNTSMVFSYKILIIFINIISVISMYLCVKNIAKSKVSGIIATIIYASANYRLVDVFTRGAIGESLALAFLPIVIWGFYELCIGERKKWYIFVIGVTGVIQSHIISVLFAIVMCFMIEIVYIMKIIKDKRYKEIIISLVMIILLNLWFILPFIDTYKLGLIIGKDEYNDLGFIEHAVIPAQLFNIFDSGASVNVSNEYDMGMIPEMCFALGLLCNIGLVISVLYCFKNKNNTDNEIKFIKILTGISVISIIMSTSIFPWNELIDKFNVLTILQGIIQFCWRFLGMATLMIPITSGIIIGKYMESKYDNKKDFIENYKIVLIIGFIACITVPIFLGDFSKQDKYDVDETTGNYDINIEYFIDGTDIEKLTDVKYYVSDAVIMKEYKKDGTNIKINYKNSSENGYIEVPLLYYPVYNAKDENGKKLEIVPGENNVIRINLNEKKEGTIILNCKDTGIYLLADIISLFTLIYFLYYLLKKCYKK